MSSLVELQNIPRADPQTRDDVFLGTLEKSSRSAVPGWIVSPQKDMLSSSSHTSDRVLFENKVFTDNINSNSNEFNEVFGVDPNPVCLASLWEGNVGHRDRLTKGKGGREEALWRWEPDQSISKPGKPEASRSWRAWKQVFLQPLEGAQLAAPPLGNAALVLLNKYTPSLWYFVMEEAWGR